VKKEDATIKLRRVWWSIVDVIHGFVFSLCTNAEFISSVAEISNFPDFPARAKPDTGHATKISYNIHFRI